MVDSRSISDRFPINIGRLEIGVDLRKDKFRRFRAEICLNRLNLGDSGDFLRICEFYVVECELSEVT